MVCVTRSSAAHEHEDREDLGPEAMEERGRGPVQALAQRAPVDRVEGLVEVAVPQRVDGPEARGLGGEREQQRGRASRIAPALNAPGALINGRIIRPAPQPATAMRDEVRDPAGRVGERLLERIADRPPSQPT